MWTGRPLIIDTDPGTDDAIALLVAAAEGLDVRLVVSTYGNVPHAHTKRNAVDLAGLLFPGTPVLYGADGPIEGRGHTAEYVHGANGVGGVRLRSFAPPDCEQGGTDALYRKIQALGRPDYIALGPLTNLARLLAAYPQVELGRVVVMGGGLHESNMDSGAEFNFACDPVAVRAVLTAAASRSSSCSTRRTRSSFYGGSRRRLRSCRAGGHAPRGQFAAILRYNYDMSLRCRRQRRDRTRCDGGAGHHYLNGSMRSPCAWPWTDRAGSVRAGPGAPNAAFTTGVDRAFVLRGSQPHMPVCPDRARLAAAPWRAMPSLIFSYKRCKSEKLVL